MKKYYFPLMLLGALILFQGCLKDKCVNRHEYVELVPVYMSYEELRESVASEAPRDIENPGKIYFKDNYILINEVDKGIHVIDNADPANPQNIRFINIPGNVDMAMMGSILYADSYIDLVAIDIMNPANPDVRHREEDVFPYRAYDNFVVDEDRGVVVDWKQVELTEELDCQLLQSHNTGIFVFANRNFATTDAAIAFSSENTKGGSGISPSLNPGIGGSMARFTVSNTYLYAVDQNNLNIFSLAEQTNPNYIAEVNIGVGIETIYPYEDKLFIGSTNGLFIYDNSNPASPYELSRFAHVTSCDPVVVEGDYAYVTLRGGTQCNGFTNQLDVIDISNIHQPKLVTTYEMKNPYGLGIDDGTLFICDGIAGLKVYDASDPMTIDQNQIAHFTDMAGYDVIPLGEILLFIGPDGFSQYNYSDMENIQRISSIPVVK